MASALASTRTFAPVPSKKYWALCEPMQSMPTRDVPTPLGAGAITAEANPYVAAVARKAPSSADAGRSALVNMGSDSCVAYRSHGSCEKSLRLAYSAAQTGSQAQRERRDVRVASSLRQLMKTPASAPRLTTASRNKVTAVSVESASPIKGSISSRRASEPVERASALRLGTSPFCSERCMTFTTQMAVEHGVFEPHGFEFTPAVKCRLVGEHQDLNQAGAHHLALRTLDH